MNKGNLVKACAFALSLVLLLGVGLSVKAASGVSFYKTLPEFQGWTDLASAKRTSNSKANIIFSQIGSDYKVNVGHWVGNTQVSAKAYDIKKKDKRYFIIDSSAKGKKLKAGGQAARWSIVKVDASGNWHPNG
ncbi:hypothetical protein P4284_07175 [Bacillus swezeyi]|uniref:hypothetical protein n=1 Tax=Bacillus swezeyi TaxID=1925020 RepID=UPI002E238F2B|nr:hypothetical protein [Bacillus swezeyi]MED2976494.1 hypothetical protein [Bacillus swezeyi]